MIYLILLSHSGWQAMSALVPGGVAVLDDGRCIQEDDCLRAVFPRVVVFAPKDSVPSEVRALLDSRSARIQLTDDSSGAKCFRLSNYSEFSLMQWRLTRVFRVERALLWTHQTPSLLHLLF